ncbi:MAG: class I SAM-dependent methyltransferase [Candidatus Woesearchaeota archaeon]
MALKQKKPSEMDYSEFVAFTKERNRPSGGIKTVQQVAVNALVNSSKKMLEIGSNTGFTSVNMALSTGCSVIGIDTNDESIREARRYACEQGVDNLVSFRNINALHMPFKDCSFDIVWCSNVASFINKKEKFFSECLRVLKYGGTLVVVPIYYRKRPPKKLVVAISKAIGCDIKVWHKTSWINLVLNSAAKNNYFLDLYYCKDFKYLNCQKDIPNYLKTMLKKPHLQLLNSALRSEVAERMSYFMNLFNKNLCYAGFSILLFQKRKAPEEIELFLTTEL